MSCLVVYDQLFYFLNTFYLVIGKGGIKQKKKIFARFIRGTNFFLSYVNE